MREVKGSGGYLKKQVRFNLLKAAISLTAFFGLSALLIYIFIFVALNIELKAVSFLVLLIPLLTFNYYLRRYHTYAGGWRGEKQVIQALKNSLSDDYYLINSLILDDKAGDIDHLILAPPGIFVVETKNWNGVISVNGDEWQRPGKLRFSAKPSIQVKRNSARIRRILNNSYRVEGIVVLTNPHATLHVNNPTVTILKLQQLSSYITSQSSRIMYSRQQLEEIGREILKHKA